MLVVAPLGGGDGVPASPINGDGVGVTEAGGGEVPRVGLRVWVRDRVRVRVPLLLGLTDGVPEGDVEKVGVTEAVREMVGVMDTVGDTLAVTEASADRLQGKKSTHLWLGGALILMEGEGEGEGL